MPRTRPPYPAECRAEAVRLTRSGDMSLPALAADLGVSSAALRHWLRQADADAADRLGARAVRRYVARPRRHARWRPLGARPPRARGRAAVADLLSASDIPIDVSRNVREAVDYLRRQGGPFTLVISSSTQLELFRRVPQQDRAAELERFLRPLPVLALNEAIADHAAGLLRRYRLSHGLLLPDALIAATALVHDVPLATMNQRDYRFIADLQLLPYPSIGGDAAMLADATIPASVPSPCEGPGDIRCRHPAR